MKKYRYSSITGFSSLSENKVPINIQFFDSEEEALVDYYQKELKKCDKRIEMQLITLNKIKYTREQLNQNFSYLEEKYPEMFV